MNRSTLILCLILLTSAALAHSKTRHSPPAKPGSHLAQLAQVYCADSTHALVFATLAALTVYCQDTVSVGNGIPLRTYVDSGKAILSPNGTLIQILSPRLQSIPHTGARYVQVRMKSGYWKGRTGYILWEEVAALPASSKEKSKRT